MNSSESPSWPVSIPFFILAYSFEHKSLCSPGMSILLSTKKKKKFWTTNLPEYYIIILLAIKGNISVHTCVRMPHFLSDKNPHECKVAVRFKMNEGEKEDPFILTGLSRYISDSVKTGSLISMLPMARAPCQVEYYFFFFSPALRHCLFCSQQQASRSMESITTALFFFLQRLIQYLNVNLQ